MSALCTAFLSTCSLANSKTQKMNPMCTFCSFRDTLHSCQTCRLICPSLLHSSLFREAHTGSMLPYANTLVLCLFVGFETSLYFCSMEMAETCQPLKLNHALLWLCLTLCLVLFWCPDHVVWRPNVFQVILLVYSHTFTTSSRANSVSYLFCLENHSHVLFIKKTQKPTKQQSKPQTKHSS